MHVPADKLGERFEVQRGDLGEQGPTLRLAQGVKEPQDVLLPCTLEPPAGCREVCLHTRSYRRAYAPGVPPAPYSVRMVTVLSSPPRLPLIAPSILSADFARMGEECRGVLDAGADLLHLDVMDGHFVPNLTMGPDMCLALRRAFPSLCLDVHLMVEDPAKFLEPFAKAGANHLTFHAERLRDDQARALAQQIRARGLTAGIAINPPTPAEIILPVLDAFDLILIMSVNPGYAGQSFIPAVLEKAAKIKPRLGPHQRLQIDGGVTPLLAPEIIRHGFDVLVAASAIFGLPAPQRGGAIRSLRGEKK